MGSKSEEEYEESQEESEEEVEDEVEVEVEENAVWKTAGDSEGQMEERGEIESGSDEVNESDSNEEEKVEVHREDSDQGGREAEDKDMNNVDYSNENLSASESPVPPQLVSHPLREEAPLHQAPSPVVPSHPVVKTVNPSRKSGEQVWPPARETVASKNPEVSRSPLMRPKRVTKDYNSFFSQNAVPKTFPSYRAPPGTQHFAPHHNAISQQ